jgi:hypothetical protein
MREASALTFIAPLLLSKTDISEKINQNLNLLFLDWVDQFFEQ